MSRINKILILFFLVLGLLFAGGWQFIQTERFAGFVNKKVSRLIERRFQVLLSFKKLEMGVFPPATILRGVTLVDKRYQPKFALTVNSMGAYFSIFDFFSNKLTIEKVLIADGEINIATQFKEKKKGEEEDKINMDEIFATYEREVIVNSPIRIKNIEIKKINLSTDDGSVEIENLKSTLQRRNIKMKGEIGEVTWTQIQDLKEKTQYNGLKFNFSINKKAINFKSLKLYSTINTLSYKGTIRNYAIDPFLTGEVNYIGDLEYIANLAAKKAKVIEEYNIQGYVEAKAKVEGKPKDLQLDFHLKGHGLESEVARVDFLDVKGNNKNGILNVSQLNVKTNEGEVDLIKGVPLFDLKKGKLILGNANVKVNNIHTNDALYVLRDPLIILKARLEGEVNISWAHDGVVFRPRPGFNINQFRLANPSGAEDPILRNPLIKIQDGFFKVEFVGDEYVFRTDLDISFKNSRIRGAGFIDEKKMDIRITESPVDLVAWGPISGVKINGNGLISAHISGPIEDVNIDIAGKVDKFSVLDLKLGTIDTNLTLNLNKTQINIHNLKGNYGSTSYTGKGELRFDQNEGLDIELDVEKSNYTDSKEMYKLIVDQLPYWPDFLNFNYGAQYKVSGPFDGEKIEVSGQLNGKNLRVVGEDFESFRVDFDYKNQILNAKRFRFNKGAGFFKGRFFYDIGKEIYEYDAELAGIALKEITLYRLMNLGYNGDLYGELYGGNTTMNEFSSRSHFRVRNGTVGSVPVNDSVLTVYNNGTDLFASGNLMGNIVELDSFFNLNKKDSSKNSYMKLKARSNDAKLLSGLFSEHNTTDERIKGGLDAIFESTFNVFQPMDLNLYFKLNDFFFERGDLEYALDPEKNKIEIVNGLVKRWDIFIGDNVNQFSSKAQGKISDKIRIEQDFRVDSSILEVVSEKVSKSFGRINGRSIVIGEKGSFSNYLEVFGEDLFIATSMIPQSFSNLSFKIILEGKELLVQELKANYGKGKVVADGNVSLTLPYPIVNINAKAEKVFYPIYKKSNLVFSGEVNLKGNKLPYLLGGNVNILHGEILDEISEFTKESTTGSDFDRFIPVEKLENKLDFIQYKLGLDILTPIPIKNGIADIRLDGSTQIRGLFLKPRLQGEFQVVPALSKFVFKGHEFILSEGKIIFDGEGPKINPVVGFVGVAKVKEWDVKLAINGRSDNVSIDLSSNPPTLSQNDILSLLTIGITEDISKDIGEGDRQNVAAVGLGSILLGQWGLKQGLESSIGFDINISPEFSESESSLLDGRTGDSSGGPKKLKSGTKIKLKKKLRKNVDISVSSVVGESIEQKQEMELIYNINKKMSVDLIYEVKSPDEETAESPESFGVDVKFRIPFR